MRNITSTWRAYAALARTRGDGMLSVPAHSVVELIEHLQELDRVFIAAESFLACASLDETNVMGAPWSEDEAEGLGYLRAAVNEAQS